MNTSIPLLRTIHLVTALGLLLLSAAACGDDDDDGGTGPQPQPPQPLAFTSRSPAPNAAGVETGATVVVVFDREINAATLTPASFLIKRDGVVLPAAVSYDAATRTARAAAPFVPNAGYEIEVTTAVRTPADSGFNAPQVWSFTTRPWQAVTVDAPGLVGSDNSLALDAGGRLHVSYQDNTNGNLKYATCGTGCTSHANWQTVAVDTAGTVGSGSSLAVDATGRVHISYMDQINADLKYATCAGGCQTAANWQAVTVESAGLVGFATSLAVGANGQVHVGYQLRRLDSPALYGDFKYATCVTNCHLAINWAANRVDLGGDPGQQNSFDVGSYVSLVVEGNGRVHATYLDHNLGQLASVGRLKYAMCLGNCQVAGTWQRTRVDVQGLVGHYTALAVDAGGRRHVSYFDLSNEDLKYATCLTNCHLSASWQRATLDASGNVGRYTSLAVGAGSRIHVGYWGATTGDGDLKYATCALDCGLATNWRSATVDSIGNVGTNVSLRVDGNGRLRVAYRDEANRDLKYIE